jgi:alpha-glucoside transport system substrate-binding protein
MPENSQQSLGRYTIHAELGKGGFATVYRATDTILERDVALKILKPGWTDDAKAVERFMREAKQASRLKHANIVTIFDVGQAEGRLFIAMELVRGRSLQQIITDDGALPWTRVLAILEQSAAALDYAHAEGLVHRDIKPANIILDESKPGSAVHVVLTDFGLVRGAEQASLSMGTTGGLLGTPEYIPPEVWDGEPATKASDIYALGCVAFYLLTGKVLFSATTPMAVLKRHAEGPVFPEQWPSGVPAEAGAVLRRALAKDPTQRQASAAELAAELRACETQAVREQAAREQEERQKKEAEGAAQITLAAEAARHAEEESARQEAQRKAKEEADRKVREEQERQRQAELAAQAAVAEKAKQEAAERERQRLAREAARQAEEEARRKEPARQQQTVAQPLQRTQPAVPPTKTKSNKTWLYVAGGVIAVIVIGILFASARPIKPPATPAPFEGPTKVPAPTQPASTKTTNAPIQTPPETSSFLDRALAGEFKGKIVTAAGWYVGADAQKFNNTMKDFQDRTGITIQYQGSNQFEALLKTAIDAGDAPDIIDSPQPALLVSLAKQGSIIDLSKSLNLGALKANYNQSWLDMAMMPGKNGQKLMAGVWGRVNGRSLVWYPKKDWDAAGYKIPTTWDEMKALMDKMVEDGTTPWCIGIESGAATGWVATDWLEDIMLRTTSLENYDKWVAGTLPFSSPEVKKAAEIMTDIWQDKYVYGGRASIAKTSFGDAPLPMFDPQSPKCLMHKQGSFITSFFPNDAKAGVDYDFFYFPPIDPVYGKPMLTSGDIWAATVDRPEVLAVMEYLTKGEHLKEWMKQGGAIAPQKDADLSWYGDEIDRGVAQIFQDATAVRFAGSDLMPSAVGAGSFWKEMTNYVAGAEDLDTALKNIDASWPK